jgi:hypothetical protein
MIQMMMEARHRRFPPRRHNSVMTQQFQAIPHRRHCHHPLFGMSIVTGPLLAVWYPYLDRMCIKYKVAARYGIGLWGPPIVKVLADEFLMEPPCLLLFFGYMNACEGGDLTTLKGKLETQFVASWLTSLTVWPVILLGTFRFLPVYAQAPLINVCCIAWDGFLSHRNALAKHQQNQNRDGGDGEKQQAEIVQ